MGAPCHCPRCVWLQGLRAPPCWSCRQGATAAVTLIWWTLSRPDGAHTGTADLGAGQGSPVQCKPAGRGWEPASAVACLVRAE